MTHSYTIMPVISADKNSFLFMCLKKLGGKFLNKDYFQAANIFATAHTSAIMTKQHMIV